MDVDEQQRALWDRGAAGYDTTTALVERTMLAPVRRWLLADTRGEVLEVAVGTGANLPHYPQGVRVVGVERSGPMLARAAERAGRVGRDVHLLQADARALPFDDDSFDTVVCTFALCGITPPDEALEQMLRVLRPGGRLLLADHVESSVAPVRALQAGADRLTATAGEHWRRRPLTWVQAAGLVVERHRTSRLRLLEAFAARADRRTGSGSAAGPAAG